MNCCFVYMRDLRFFFYSYKKQVISFNLSEKLPSFQKLKDNYEKMIYKKIANNNHRVTWIWIKKRKQKKKIKQF